MEQLITRMGGESKDIMDDITADAQRSVTTTISQGAQETQIGAQSANGVAPCPQVDSLNKYLASNFWRSLTNEVEGLKQTMDDDSDLDDTSPYSTQLTTDGYIPRPSILFGATLDAPKNLRLLHPSPANMLSLFTIYTQNVDTVFKVLHIPTLQRLVTNASENIDHIPSGNFVEALLFAIYYAAITTLTPEQCLQHYQDGRDSLLAKYRSGVERAFYNADLLNTTDLDTLQALVIFLITVRSNDDSRFGWTLFGLAVRLAHSFGLHREVGPSVSPFEREIRRRLWWQIIVLDVRNSEDRGTEPMIYEVSYNTKKPLNINDGDMAPESLQPIQEQVGYTEMTKSYVSHYIAFWSWRFAHIPPVQDGQEPPRITFEEKLTVLEQVEKHLKGQVLIYCDLSNPIQWVTSVVTQLILRKMRLNVYHPLQYDERPPGRGRVTKEKLLQTAVEVVELSHLLHTEPRAAQWRWSFKTYVQWHALAATLAELCVQSQGSLVERAWRIVDVVFEQEAARIADSRHGLLWRPIKKLMSKAQAQREEFRKNGMAKQAQMPLPQFETTSTTQFEDPVLVSTSSADISTIQMDQLPSLDQSFVLGNSDSSDQFAFLNVTESPGSINWAEWDELMQDFQMEDLPETWM